MKRLFKTAAALCMLVTLAVPSTAFAGQVTADSAAQVQESTLTGTAQIRVTNEAAFAGCEFKLVCPDGVSVKSVSYDVRTTSKAGPLTNAGATYFSFFSGANDYSGTVSATVTFECTEKKNTQVTLESAKIYTINNVNPDTEVKNLNQTIAISFDGSGASQGSSEGGGASGGNGSSGTENGSSGSNGQNGGAGTSRPDSSLPKTGDAPMASVILVVAVSLSAVVLIKRKRNCN